jgi:hypothetical protein
MNSVGQGSGDPQDLACGLAIGTLISSARTTRENTRRPADVRGPPVLCRAHQIRHADLVDLVTGVADGDGRSSSR